MQLYYFVKLSYNILIMKLINEMTGEEAAGVRYVLMDIDDTITRRGKLLASSFDALWRLHEAGIRVIPVTGRPAGWCDCIVREWPVDGVVGENGAFAYWEEPSSVAGRLPERREAVYPTAVRNDHPALAKIKARALAEVPGLRVAKDQFARQFDLALDFAEEEPILPLSAAEKVRDIALEEGAQAKVSSIHVNIWMGRYDKVSMAERYLNKRFGWQPGAEDRQVVFVGDSPTDEPMFARFPLACAVANIKKYEDLVHHYPAFVASRDCGDGFAEIAAHIVRRILK
jgi:HAD superfamily hydrolase (TIGR01484 family)